MNDSMAQPRAELASLELSGWKAAASWLAAVLIGLLFIVSGIWKVTGVEGASIRMAQAKVPESLSVAAALGIGIAEMIAGVLLIVPRFRRWGAILTSVLLVAFMVYVGVHYRALTGEDCSCFPWLKRVVGPGFFVGDTIMLALAVLAGVWSKRPSALRSAVIVCGAVTVFALVSYGVETVRWNAREAPATITIAGRDSSIAEGKYFLYFFHPACEHCRDGAKRLARLSWGDTKVIVVPVELPQYAGRFLAEAGLSAAVTSDFERLKEPLGYTAYPYGVALDGGRVKASLTQFEGEEPEATLKRAGFVY